MRTHNRADLRGQSRSYLACRTRPVAAAPAPQHVLGVALLGQRIRRSSSRLLAVGARHVASRWHQRVSLRDPSIAGPGSNSPALQPTGVRPDGSTRKIDPPSRKPGGYGAPRTRHSRMRPVIDETT